MRHMLWMFSWNEFPYYILYIFASGFTGINFFFYFFNIYRFMYSVGQILIVFKFWILFSLLQTYVHYDGIAIKSIKLLLFVSSSLQNECNALVHLDFFRPGFILLLNACKAIQILLDINTFFTCRI